LDLYGPGEKLITEATSAATRSRLRSKERRLQKLTGFRYLRAQTPDDVDRLLAQFFPLKDAHMAAQGIDNVFAEPGAQDFIRDICRIGLAADRPVLQLHALEADGE